MPAGVAKPTYTTPGPSGPAGPIGPEGPEGPAGPSTGDLAYRHQQLSPSSVWTINHNLGKRPSVDSFDSSYDEIWGDEAHVDDNTMTITFSAATGGEAYCN